MKIKFLQSGESPDFGPFKEGDEADLDDATAQILKDRGVVTFTKEQASPSFAYSAPSAVKKKSAVDVDV